MKHLPILSKLTELEANSETGIIWILKTGHLTDPYF